MFIDRIAAARGQRLFASALEQGALSEVVIACKLDVAEYLHEATAFCNNTLAGARCAQLILHPLLVDDRAVKAALTDAVGRLGCGAVAINDAPARLGWMALPPWKAPGDAGFGNNALMLGGVDKAVLWAPLRARRPLCHEASPTALSLCETMTGFGAAPTLRGAWAVAGR